MDNNQYREFTWHEYQGWHPIKTPTRYELDWSEITTLDDMKVLINTLIPLLNGGSPGGSIYMYLNEEDASDKKFLKRC